MLLLKAFVIDSFTALLNPQVTSWRINHETDWSKKVSIKIDYEVERAYKG